MARTPQGLPPHAEATVRPDREGSVEPLAELAYRRIKAAIMDGSLPPGSQVSEQQIAARLQVSRTPVHQAVSRLQQERWLSLAPKRGVVIATLDPTEIADVYEALASLEGTAVARLATGPGPLDPAVARRLEDICAEGEGALAAGDVEAWSRADGAFHDALVGSCGNPRVAALALTLHEHAHRACYLTLRLRPLPVGSAGEHREIVAAVAARDPVRARAQLEGHRARGIASMLPVLQALSASHDSWMRACMR